jgi:uncharacterized protein
MLDGYLTSIVIGPRSIPPDEWLVDLLGEHAHIAPASGTTLVAIMGNRRTLQRDPRRLVDRPQQYAPIFETADDGTVLPHPWCTGFLAAMRLRLEEWRPRVI